MKSSEIKGRRDWSMINPVPLRVELNSGVGTSIAVDLSMKSIGDYQVVDASSSLAVAPLPCPSRVFATVECIERGEVALRACSLKFKSVFSPPFCSGTAYAGSRITSNVPV